MMRASGHRMAAPLLARSLEGDKQLGKIQGEALLDQLSLSLVSFS